MAGVGVGAPSKVVCLINVVEAKELYSDKNYNGILGDLTEVGKRYGNLVKVVIPRPTRDGSNLSSGVGRVFLEYADTASSSQAQETLNDMKFAGERIGASFYSEVAYNNESYDAV